jgi:hypothetical protein
MSLCLFRALFSGFAFCFCIALNQYFIPFDSHIAFSKEREVEINVLSSGILGWLGWGAFVTGR